MANGTVYIGDAEVGGVYGFASQTGEQVWSFETQTSVTSSPAVTAGTEDGTVFAVSSSDRSANWEFDAAGEVTGAPVVQNRRVYVTTAEGTIHCITTENGTEQWVTETDETIRSSPTIDETSLYVGDGRRFEQPGNLYSIDIDSGAIEWSFDTEGSYGGRQGAIEESPTVGSERVYFDVDANKVYAVNKDDGTEAWQFDTAVVLSSPSIHEGTLYIGNDNNTVLTLE